MMFRHLLALLLVPASLSFAAADAAPGLQGRVEGSMYVSPTGTFKVAIPVLPQLGGEITDTPNVVTFEDAYNTHITIAAFPQDATQRWELSTRGVKDYLIYFFSNFVLADFKQTFEDVKIESAKFGALPGLPDGALISYIVIPGGSMFADKIPQYGGSDRVILAKRGNLLFIRNGHTFVVSIELAERLIEGSAYQKKLPEEDEILRARLADVLGKIQFAKPPASAPVPPPAAAPKK
ncbi:MAG: hypothetical protein RIQ93_531 [Verrucomicrobiota bacterium]|jgi:hypothetical protein